MDHIIESGNNDYASSMRIMIQCLQLIRCIVPAVGVASMKVARRFWEFHSVPTSDLERARVNCWQYLDERSASTNTELPEYCAVRAVICVLYAEPPSDDLSELVGFFVEMLAGALDHESESTFVSRVISAVDGS
jgi:hypothetical protein